MTDTALTILDQAIDWPAVIKRIGEAQQFPAAEADLIKQFPEQAVPHLIAAMEQSIAAAIAGSTAEQLDNTCYFGLVIIGDLQLTQCLPTLQKLLKLNDQQMIQLLGDIFLDFMPSLIYQFTHDRITTFFDLLNDPALSVYSRWVAADAISFMLLYQPEQHEQILPQLLNSLQQLLSEFQASQLTKVPHLLMPIVASILDDWRYLPAREIIKQVFELEYANTGPYVSWKDLNFSKPESDWKPLPTTENSRTLIRNYREVFEKYYNKPNAHHSCDDPHCHHDHHHGHEHDDHDHDAPSMSQQQVHAILNELQALGAGYDGAELLRWQQSQHQLAVEKQSQAITTKPIGKNDRCPCKSGMKYKNCCGRKQG